MNISEILWTSYVYQKYTDYDSGYEDLSRDAGIPLMEFDLERMKRLLIWLNKWGCRTILKDNYDLISENLRDFLERNKAVIEKFRGISIKNFERDEITKLEGFYDELKYIDAGHNKKKNKRYHIGTTGASKIMHILFPDLCVPWDSNIRREFGLKETGEDYIKFLEKMKKEVLGLEDSYITFCKKHKVAKRNVNEFVRGILNDKTEKSITKMIDEFNWITITKKFDRLPPRTLLDLLSNNVVG